MDFSLATKLGSVPLSYPAMKKQSNNPSLQTPSDKENKKPTKQTKIPDKQKPKKPQGQHHDIFFKSFFSDPKLALEIFQLVFTKEELSLLKTSELKNEKDSFTDKYADLIFSAPLKDYPKVHVKIFIILEHKSRYDVSLFSQLLYYQAYLHEQTVKKYGRPMPIIPVVFYHGKQPWRWEKSFQEAFWPQGGGKKDKKSKTSLLGRESMLDYQVRVLDVQDPKLRGVFRDERVKSRGAFLLFKKAWGLRRMGEVELKGLVSLFWGVASGIKRDQLLLSVVHYMRSLGVGFDVWGKVERLLVNEGLFKKGGYMDIREHIKAEGVREGWQKGQQEGWQKGRQEGRQEGQQEGWQKGQQELILKMLEAKADMSLISRVTGLSEQKLKKLQNGSKK